MFTGIVECTGKVLAINEKGSSTDFEIAVDFVNELKVDQSISHNGVCLTVTELMERSYRVTAIPETLRKTNLGRLKAGDTVNLERSMKADGRFDGHIVQGHIDQTAECISIRQEGDSYLLTFRYDDTKGNYMVEKGSVCMNGISLTVIDSKDGEFSVAVIPYTFEFTNVKFLRTGDIVNVEFDVIGKYLRNLFLKYQTKQ